MPSKNCVRMRVIISMNIHENNGITLAPYEAHHHFRHPNRQTTHTYVAGSSSVASSSPSMLPENDCQSASEVWKGTECTARRNLRVPRVH